MSRRALSSPSETAAASPHLLVRQRISELLDLLGMMEDGRERPAVAQSLRRLRQQEEGGRTTASIWGRRSGGTANAIILTV